MRKPAARLSRCDISIRAKERRYIAEAAVSASSAQREDSDVRTFIQDYFDHNKELTPDSLYWGVPSYRVINEAKGEFSKQQVLDGRRRPKPLLASKKYGNMWW